MNSDLPPEKTADAVVPKKTSSKTKVENPLSKVEFLPLNEDAKKTRQMESLTPKEMAKWKDLKVQLEVLFGTTKMTLQELASLEAGNVLPFSEHSKDPVEIRVNGKSIGRGEIVTVEGRFAVKILDFEKNIKKC